MDAMPLNVTSICYVVFQPGIIDIINGVVFPYVYEAKLLFICFWVVGPRFALTLFLCFSVYGGLV